MTPAEARERAVDAAANAVFRQRSAASNASSRDFAEAAIAVYEAAMWQPIETAQRDGTPLLAAAFPKQTVFIVRWDGFDWMDAGLGLREPTHWRPLPAGPGDAT